MTFAFHCEGRKRDSPNMKGHFSMSNGSGCSKQHTVISAATGCEGVPDENPATNSSGDHKTAITADRDS
jgi:hypothetical protein